MKKTKEMKKTKLFLAISFILIVLYFNYLASIKVINYIIYIISLKDIRILTLGAEESISVILYLMGYLTIISLFPIIYIIFYNCFKDAFYKKELHVIKKIPLVYFVGVLGAILGFIIGLHVMIPFMIKYNEVLNLELTLTLSNLIKTIIINSMVFSLVSLVPAMIKYLIYFDLLSKETLKKKRKIVFFICLIIAGFVSPAEFFTMFIILIPLYGSFEFGLFLSKKDRVEN